MKTYNIPIFVPHKGCPHDCIFCNQKRIAGNIASVGAADVDRIISGHLKTIQRNGAHIEAAFFGGSFTGIPRAEQNELLGAAHEFLARGEIDGIRLSTRPDYIDDDILANLKKYDVSVIELGVQSMDDRVLMAAERGYKAEVVRTSSALIKEYGITLGLQMMTGLPGDSNGGAIYTAREIIKLAPETVRIYPTLVVKDTPLERMYREGRYTPQSVESAVQLCKELYKMFTDNGITVIRTSLQTTDEINPNASVVAGPFHAAFGELVEGELYYDKICACLDAHAGATVIYVAPRELSKAIGNKKRNTERLKQKYGEWIRICPRADVAPGSVSV